MAELIKRSVSIVLVLILCMPATAKTTNTHTKKPTEILSDPFNYGIPTNYTIIKGNTEVRFSHPFLGQFSRAESKRREKDGFVTTRFRISKDRKRYLPVMRLFTPFEIHNYAEAHATCESPSALQDTVKSVFNGVTADQYERSLKAEVAALKTAKVFDASCFDKELAPNEQEAILQGVAQISLPVSPPTATSVRYGQCLKSYGLADEAARIEAAFKGVKTQSQKPAFRIACTLEDDAEGATFNEEKNTLTLKVHTKPDREYYARRTNHDLLHKVGLIDHSQLVVVDECCSNGKNCDRVEAMAVLKRKTERTIATTAQLNPQSEIAAAAHAASAGADRDLFLANREQNFSKIPMPTQKSKNCLLWASECDATIKLAQSSYSYHSQCFASGVLGKNQFSVIHFLISSAIAENQPIECENSLNNSNKDAALLPTADSMAKDQSQLYQVQSTGRMTARELGEKLAVSGPIDWSGPVEQPKNIEAPVQLRGIASVAALPKPRADVKMGVESDARTDVATGRATFIVDTVERASVALDQTITPTTVAERRVDQQRAIAGTLKSNRVAAAGMEPTFIVANFPGSKLEIADFSDVKIGFDNPFANEKPKTAKAVSQTVAKGGSGSKPQNSAPTQTGTLTIALVGEEDADEEPEKGAAALTTQASSGSSSGGGGSSARQTASSSNGGSNDNSGPARVSFKQMPKNQLILFITSDSRAVSRELNNPDLREALEMNGIVIQIKPGSTIGAAKPDMKFILNKDIGRFVQSR